MTLSLKPNWPEAGERLEAFWRLEVLDRPCIAVTALNGPRRPVRPPRDAQEKWTDPDYLVESLTASFEATYWGGESLPASTLLVGYCFGHGAQLHYHEQTIWQSPIVHDWNAPPSFAFDESDPGWRQIEAVVRALVESNGGRYFVSHPAILLPNDLLSVLCDPTRFCTDLLDHPEAVKQALAEMLETWFVLYDRTRSLLAPTQDGTADWLGVWHPGRMCTIQSDICCMLSPAMFEEFILPELEAFSNRLDGVIYHLDGPGALKHLDRLLELPRLRGIQWTPGTGHPTGLHWLDLYRRIQAKGKAVWVSLDKSEVPTAVRELKPEGLFIATGAGSAEEAECILEDARRATVSFR